MIIGAWNKKNTKRVGFSLLVLKGLFEIYCSILNIFVLTD